MLRSFILFSVAIVIAGSSFGSYLIDPSRIQFMFEDEMDARLRTTDDWYEVYRSGGTATLQNGRPVMTDGKYVNYGVTMKSFGKTVKGWGLAVAKTSTSQPNIRDCVWNYSNSTNCTFGYNSSYENCGTAYLYLHLRYFRYGIEFWSDDSTQSRSVSGICYTNEVLFESSYEPLREGYDFAGWTNGVLSAAIQSGERRTGEALDVQRDGDVVSLYAKWAAKTVAVTFDPNGYGASVSPGTKNVTYDSLYGDLPVPTRASHVFEGWFTAAEGGDKVDRDDKVDVAEPHTLYAHWRRTYTVVFRDDSTVYASYSGVERGASVTPPAAGSVNVPAGKSFIGWSSDAYGNVTDDLVIRPVFSDVSVRISVGCEPSDGGSVSITGNDSYAYGRTVTLTATPNRAYDFIGWSDGVQANPRSVVAICDTNLVARFSKRLSDLSAAVDCGSLLIESTDGSWVVSNDSCCVGVSSAKAIRTPSSSRMSVMTASVDCPGTLTFLVRTGSPLSRAPFLLETNDVSNSYQQNSPVLSNISTAGRWIRYSVDIKGPANVLWKNVWYEDDMCDCWVDDVQWHPNRFVEVSGSSTVGNPAAIAEAVLRNWESMLGDEAESVNTVCVDAASARVASVASALGFDLEAGNVSVNDGVATLTFRSGNLDILIDAFSMNADGSLSLTANVKYGDAVPGRIGEAMGALRILGAPSLDSAFEDVGICPTDLDGYTSSGDAVFSFGADGRGHRFFKVVADER